MKPSNYNFYFLTDNNTVLLHNSRTNALLEVEEGEFDIVKASLFTSSLTNTKDFSMLFDGGFIIEDHIDEPRLIELDIFQSRFDSSAMTLTIAVTNDCNFRCPYCYEKEVINENVINDQVADAIIAFIDSRKNSLQVLNIFWYGGEPLLQFERIKDMSYRIIQMCDKYGITYAAGMATNGYFLTPETMGILSELRLKTIQITLDGMPVIHNKRRRLEDGSGTFDKIFQNLISLESMYRIENHLLPLIALRINADKTNIDSCFELITSLSRSPLVSYVNPYLAAIYDSNDKNYNYSFSTEEYIEILHRFSDHMIECGFNVPYGLFYPKRLAAYCTCDRFNSFVIDALGNTYNCWEEIGDLKAQVGSVIKGLRRYPSGRYYEYLLNNPLNVEKCRKCSILPSCMGGNCPLRFHRDQRVFCDANQTIYKKNLIKAIKLLGKNVTQEFYL